MSHTTLDQLGRAVIGRLYDVVCGGDAAVAAPGGTFLTWCAPGQVWRPEDFEFCRVGLGAGSGPGEQRRLVGQARRVAELVDVLPAGGAGLAARYRDVLRRCRVVHGGLTDEERLKVGKYRDLLRTTRKIADPATGEQWEVTEDGPMLRAYQAKRAGYLDAVLANNLARTAGGPAASGAEQHRQRVDAALDAWLGCGYRNEIDQITAYLDRIGQRDLVPWCRAMVEMYDAALIGGAGGAFRYTTLVPGDFTTSPCWPELVVGGAGALAEPTLGSASWRAGAAGLEFGTCGVPADRTLCGGLRIAMGLRLVLIARPWFYPEFFACRGWTLDGEPVCDGGDPPRGGMVGYPSIALFARDLRIWSVDLVDAYRRHSPGRSIGWGPLQLGGATLDGCCITVTGIQLLGFVNQQLGKAPDPAPQLDSTRFV